MRLHWPKAIFVQRGFGATSARKLQFGNCDWKSPGCSDWQCVRRQGQRPLDLNRLPFATSPQSPPWRPQTLTDKIVTGMSKSACAGGAKCDEAYVWCSYQLSEPTLVELREAKTSRTHLSRDALFLAQFCPKIARNYHFR